jgi:hypothetical protein
MAIHARPVSALIFICSWIASPLLYREGRENAGDGKKYGPNKQNFHQPAPVPF